MRNQLRTIRLIVADGRTQPAPGAMTRHTSTTRLWNCPLPSSPARETLTRSRRTGQEVAHDREGW
jgi:hypothetical protein